MAARRAVAGDSFWALHGEARPPSPWLEDPPHETPGWYSVYVQDQRTLAVFTAHAAALQTFAAALSWG
jgi:mannan endo-1,4-beta-mannosidase